MPSKPYSPVPQEWWVATRNPDKLKELTFIAPQWLTLHPLPEDFPPLYEPFHSLVGNALAKALPAHWWLGTPVLAEDTALEVKALGGLPGVHTARFGGEHLTTEERISLLLRKLQGVKDRRARFRTVVVAAIQGSIYTFEGHCNGYIAQKPSGEGGFGYDPVFIPEGYNRTFAELPPTIKNRISHRARAFNKFVTWLCETFCLSVSSN